ncbi:hypothetical protein [Aeromonas piscicola]|uniref:hypothetical protein n=1 Tax=Aeromonas piscicola TaxID=600645 RepID=UPI0021F8A4D3|nr:hypothetical protein [Aeromonas piscicola]MCW0507213.1 hypothetical protein [Aeromonas piscicola]
MEETRKCEIPQSYGDPKPAVFHRWGDKLIYDDEGRPQRITTAVVEFQDGKVAQVEPQSVKFIK